MLERNQITSEVINVIEPANTTFYYFSKKTLGKIAEGLQETTGKIRLG